MAFFCKKTHLRKTILSENREISGLNFDLISKLSFALTLFVKRMFLYNSLQNSI